MMSAFCAAFWSFREGVGDELDGAPAVTIPLRTAARENSTSDRRQVACKCKGSCDTRRCLCRKAARQCTQYCHNAERQYSNIGTIEEATNAAIVLDTPLERELTPLTTMVLSTSVASIPERRKRSDTITGTGPAKRTRSEGGDGQLAAGEGYSEAAIGRESGQQTLSQYPSCLTFSHVLVGCWLSHSTLLSMFLSPLLSLPPPPCVAPYTAW